jgi:tetratricopeptide (TPR) repeat protein
MNRLVFLLATFSFISIHSFAQATSERMLFIIDSIPLYNDPEPWNPITKEDIADMKVIRNKDSLKALGWEDVDAASFIFTKAYRSRPDSLKKIPSLKQMEMKNGVWFFEDTEYTGKYIDYYNSGKIQDEGTLINGILNGELIVYRKNGNRKTASHYRDGKLYGEWNEYYPNGALYSTRNYTAGKTGFQKEYFINGRLMHEVRAKRKTLYDSSVYYYSNGNIKQVTLIINGVNAPDKKAEDLSYYGPLFFQNLNAGKLKEANKYFYKLWLIDSTSSDTYYKEGLLSLKEFRFDDAIEAFDKAIRKEPLMGEALSHRALARIKKYKYAKLNVFAKDFKETWLTADDMVAIPAEEQRKICNDLQHAIEVDFTETYVQRVVPSPILEYCQRRSN